MRTVRNLVIVWALLIALYLLVVHYVGAAAILGAVDRTGSDFTRTLQGR